MWFFDACRHLEVNRRIVVLPLPPIQTSRPCIRHINGSDNTIWRGAQKWIKIKLCFLFCVWMWMWISNRKCGNERFFFFTQSNWIFSLIRVMCSCPCTWPYQHLGESKTTCRATSQHNRRLLMSANVRQTDVVVAVVRCRRHSWTVFARKWSLLVN